MNSIYRKLVVYFLLLNLFAIGSIGFYSYYKEKEALLSRTFDQLISLRIEKKNRITEFFNQRIRDMENVSNMPQIKKTLHELVLASNETLAKKYNGNNASDSNIFFLMHFLISPECYTRFYYIDNSNRAIVVNIKGSSFTIQKPNADTVKILQKECLDLRNYKGVLLKEIHINQDERQKMMVACKSIVDRTNRFSGLIITGIDPKSINKIMFENNPNNGLRETGEVYLVGDDTLMRSNSRFYKNSVFKTRVNTYGVRSALSGKTAYSELNDYRNIPVLSSYGPVDFSDIHWVVLAEIDVKEAMIPIYSIRDNIIYLSLLIALLSAAMITFLAQKFSDPIKKLQTETTKIAMGEYGNTIEVETKDEIGRLTQSFNKMSVKIKEQSLKLENEKKLRLRSVIDAQEKERQRLSRELHDGLGPLLLTGKMKLERALSTDNKDRKKSINEVIELILKTIGEIRNISNDIMPPGLKEFGLKVALQNFCRQITESHTIEINCLIELSKQHYGKTTDIYIFRIAQEAVNNVLKHAKATEIHFNLEEIDNHLFLTISDNGKGLDNKSKSYSSGNGIINMKERVNLLNGYFEISGKPGKGTTIEIDIPIS